MQYSSQILTGWWSVAAIGKSIECRALHGGLSFCKTQQVVGFDCAGIERLSVPQPNSCLLLGEPICIRIFSSALSGSSWADTPSYRNVLYPAGPCSY